MRLNLLSWLWRRSRSRLKAWRGGDAIRCSPTERFWLKIEPPCVILWQGERIEVLSRREIFTEAGVAIQFDCATPRGRENLIVQPGGLHQPPICEWTSP